MHAKRSHSCKHRRRREQEKRERIAGRPPVQTVPSLYTARNPIKYSPHGRGTRAAVGGRDHLTVRVSHARVANIRVRKGTSQWTARVTRNTRQRMITPAAARRLQRVGGLYEVVNTQHNK